MTHFFSCDWGTTSFRLRRVDAETGEVLAERREPSGVKALLSRCTGDDPAVREKTFADFLGTQLRLLGGGSKDSLDGASVLISGMASSSVGWRELPYAHVPVALDGSGIERTSFAMEVEPLGRACINLISGVRAETDIMRGEETEILGLFAGGKYADMADQGIVVLPGTHSKHVHLRQRRIITFRTYMTGELFDVLCAHSLLRVSVQTSDGMTAAPFGEPASQEAFAAGVRGAAGSGMAGGLFQTRVRTILRNISPQTNAWFLSGLLIGSEVVNLSVGETDSPILLAAPAPLNAIYRVAFEILGMEGRLQVVPSQEMAQASVRGHLTLLRHLALRPGGKRE